jgi:hypothetical protein
LLIVSYSAAFDRNQKQILRCALQKLDALLVSIEQLGPSLSEPSSPRN